jgi:hypothetical protein
MPEHVVPGAKHRGRRYGADTRTTAASVVDVTTGPVAVVDGARPLRSSDYMNLWM